MSERDDAPMTDLDLLQLNPRKEMPRIRQAIGRRLQAGQSPAALVRALAVRDSQALAELIIGPKAFTDRPVILAALDVVETLEQVIPVAKLYPRLADLAGEAATEVLKVAVARHPRAQWLVPLSVRIEGIHAGVGHLRIMAGKPGFSEAVARYARAGCYRGLVKVAGELGSPEPAAALALLGEATDAAEAAARALQKDPSVPIVAWLAGAWGPDLEPLLLRMIAYLRDLATHKAFRQQVCDYPAVLARLDAIEGG